MLTVSLLLSLFFASPAQAAVDAAEVEALIGEPVRLYNAEGLQIDGSILRQEDGRVYVRTLAGAEVDVGIEEIDRFELREAPEDPAPDQPVPEPEPEQPVSEPEPEQPVPEPDQPKLAPEVLAQLHADPQAEYDEGVAAGRLAGKEVKPGLAMAGAGLTAGACAGVGCASGCMLAPGIALGLGAGVAGVAYVLPGNPDELPLNTGADYLDGYKAGYAKSLRVRRGSWALVGAGVGVVAGGAVGTGIFLLQQGQIP